MIYNGGKYNQHWSTKKLSELGTFSRGVSKHRPRNDTRLFENGKYPLIQTGDIKEANLYVTSHSQEYGEFGLKQSKLWDKGTLCITIAANIAETAILAYPMCFPDSVVGFNANSNESSELFMYYVFEYIRNSIQNSASGSIQDNINIEYLTGLNFKVPDKQNQDKITNLLGVIDGKILLNRKINDNFSTVNGKYKFFTCSNVPLQCDEYAFESSSILIAGNGDFNVKYYSGKFNAYQRTYVLTASSEYYAILYLACLYQVNLFKSNSSGSIVKFITKSDVENIPLFIPDDISLLQKLNNLLHFQEQNILENDKLIQLRDFLLPMLMNGQATIDN